MKLHGRDFRRDELLDLVGDIDQLGGVTPLMLTDGPARGTRAIAVRSPGGLSFVCLPDRGLDVGWADYRGMPLAWRSPVGDVAPAFADPAGQGWLRSFGGGLVVTCGLASVGQPGIDQGEPLGLHGRFSSTPAHDVRCSADWSGDERVVTIRGRVREASALGPVLELRRTMTTTLGGNALLIEDTVCNLGASVAPHMFRYHVNLGFPLIDHHSRIACEGVAIDARDVASKAGLASWNAIDPPSQPTAEQVFVVTMPGGVRQACAMVRNPSPRPSLRLLWSGDTLPLMLVWKQPTRRTYVTALEPSNCNDGGRAAERNAGRLVQLRPGEERHYRIELRVILSETTTANPAPAVRLAADQSR